MLLLDVFAPAAPWDAVGGVDGTFGGVGVYYSPIPIVIAVSTCKLLVVVGTAVVTTTSPTRER